MATAVMRFALLVLTILGGASISSADDVQLLRRARDPYGYPRPASGEIGVPVGTSLFFQLGFKDKESVDAVLPDSVSVSIETAGGSTIHLVRPGKQFADGYTGSISPSRNPKSALAVYIDGEAELQPSTLHAVVVRARSRDGGQLRDTRSKWQFTTAPMGASHTVPFRLDLSAPPVHWHGGFFTGFCKPSFCTSASNRIDGYALMQQVQQNSPRAWSLQRDFSLTTMQHQPKFLDGAQPNVVRERETRRIIAVERQDGGTLLQVQDFFGHEQYGISSQRPLGDDYRVGDEVLIADGISDATATVLKVVADSPQTRSLLVSDFEMPDGGWKIEYAKALQTVEDPHAPGLFPPGGCYLRKLRPAGTPCFYWGRVDKEWDIAHRQFGRRLVVNFADAPGDLSVDGRGWTYPKDYAQYHQVVRETTSHLIERYGDACLGFVWSVLNEPDLAIAFWRSRDWDELQKFYDYTVDGILRSFEDHGYDSNHVIVGGLEIGGIFGDRIDGPILRKFLCHCSPTATCDGALELNAAFADPRLDGKRSKRLEDLCRSSDGKGSPCDFISVHCYNAAPMAAAKLRRAKELALEVDAAYFADLWVNCFESCPAWAPPPDLAAADSYLGNGYFATWCADVARRQLAAAVEDRRYGFGESILTFWPWPNSNLRGNNNATQVLAVDEDGDGQMESQQTVALPILRFLGLLARMGDRYWVLPERSIGEHVISGFASRVDDRLYVLVYAHNAHDVQSRSKDDLQVCVEIPSAPWREVDVDEYRFDKDHNSYFRLGRQLRDPSARRTDQTVPAAEEVERLLAHLESDDRALQLAAVRKAAAFNASLPEAVLIAAMRLYERTADQRLRTEIEQAGRKIASRKTGFHPDQVARIRELSQLRTTRQSSQAADEIGSLELTFSISANGASFIVIQPTDDRSAASVSE